MSDRLFDLPDFSDRDERLVAAYARAGRTLDDLPYTREFDALVAEAGLGDAPADVFRRLHTLRKAGRLPKTSLRGTSPAAVTSEEESALIALVVAEAGSLGQRDRLPFTPAFDRVHTAFNARSGRSLTPHDLWRLVARLAK
jgi:hypothetical protein